MKRTLWFTLGLTALTFALGFAWLRPQTDTAHAPASAPVENAVTDTAAALADATATPSPQSAAPQALSAEADAFIRGWQARFADHLTHPAAQVRALDALVRWLRERYGADWLAHAAAWLNRLAPDQAEQLLALLNNLEAYRQWLSDERYSLATLTPEERRARLWAQREALFGEDAYRIWEGQWKNEQLEDRLVALGQSGAPIEAQVEAWTSAIRDIWGEQADQVLSRHTQELVDRFLNRDAVQDQLADMPASKREDTLRKLRQAMGMDDAALDRWSELDQVRDARWQKGQAYLAEREKLTQTLSGPELDAALSALRQRYFGPEATLIAREEASGFFRYREPRRYGIN